MPSKQDLFRALGASLRKGYPLAERLSNRQFEDLLRDLARLEADKGGSSRSK